MTFEQDAKGRGRRGRRDRGSIGLEVMLSHSVQPRECQEEMGESRGREGSREKAADTGCAQYLRAPSGICCPQDSPDLGRPCQCQPS